MSQPVSDVLVRQVRLVLTASKRSSSEKISKVAVDAGVRKARLYAFAQNRAELRPTEVLAVARRLGCPSVTPAFWTSAIPSSTSSQSINESKDTWLAPPDGSPRLEVDWLTVTALENSAARIRNLALTYGRPFFFDKCRYRWSYKICGVLLIQWGLRSKNGANRIRLDGNPANPTVAWLMAALLPLLVASSIKVTRLDFAIDYKTPMDSFALVPINSRISSNPGSRQTVWGKRPRRLHQYDKAKELEKKFGLIANGPWTRIESQWRPAKAMGIEDALRRHPGFAGFTLLPLRGGATLLENAYLSKARLDGACALRESLEPVAFSKLVQKATDRITLGFPLPDDVIAAQRQEVCARFLCKTRLRCDGTGYRSGIAR